MKKILFALISTIGLALAPMAFAGGDDPMDMGMDFDFDLDGTGDWNVQDQRGTVDGISAGFAEGDLFEIVTNNEADVELSSRDDSGSDPESWASLRYRGDAVSNARSGGEYGEGLAVSGVLIDASTRLESDRFAISGDGDGTMPLDESDVSGGEEPADDGS